MIDTHAHLFLCENTIETLIQAAHKSGVTGIINVATDIESAVICARQAEQYKTVYASIGIHPCDWEKAKDVDKIPQHLNTHPFVAIGEIGLDYYHAADAKTAQIALFRQQLDIARDAQLPVIIHNRHSESDMVDVLKAYPNVPRVFHCFSGDWHFVEAVDTDASLYSFTGMITYAKKGKTLQTIKQLPIEKIMLETDCPYLTPKRYRGQENQPAFLPEIAKKIAEIKEMSVKDVIDITSRNARDFFKLS